MTDEGQTSVLTDSQAAHNLSGSRGSDSFQEPAEPKVDDEIFNWNGGANQEFSQPMENTGFQFGGMPYEHAPQSEQF